MVGTTQEFWGAAGDGVNGIWGDVFDWTTNADNDFKEENIGGDGGEECVVDCNPITGGPGDRLGEGCSCDSVPDVGGQIVGFHVG